MSDKAESHVRKWVSNLAEVLADVPDEDHGSEVDLEKNELPVIKSLVRPGLANWISSCFIIRRLQKIVSGMS